MTFRSASNSLLILALGVFTVGTDLFILNGLLPTIAADLKVTESTAGQLTTVFAATYALGSPLIAAFTGAWDRRVLLGGGMAIFVVGMVGQAVGTTFAVLAAARVVAALGAAAFQANAFVVAGATASEATRGRALSLVAAGVSVSSVLGVPIGVFAGASVGWRGVMWGIAAIGTVVAVAVLALPRVTVPSAGLRARLSVLVRPSVTRVLLVTVLGLTASFSVFVYLPVIAADVAPGVAISWVLAANGLGSVVGNWFAGRWTDRVGPRRVRLVSIAGSAVLLAVMNAALLSLPSLLVAAVMLGAVGGMLMVPQQHRLFTLAPDAPTVALGLNGSAIYVGAALGSAIGGLALSSAGAAWLAPVAAIVAVGAVIAAAENTAVPVREPAPA
ncbi:MFS transporter [Actinophytocola sp.]|uniref:MFS transporter n=1 Tax=Actinophytocola sp. TaxID=1872138 RepID=UPI002ED324F9